jgi:DNA-binding LacI/PurR family transcriptional regulator
VVFPYIDVDGGLGVYQSVKHLVERGRRKIAALAWPEDSRVGNNRMAGYFRAMDECGLVIENQWIIRGGEIMNSDIKHVKNCCNYPQP